MSRKILFVLLLLIIGICQGVEAGSGASFVATPTYGSYPLTVQFTDTSTNSPTQWVWYFGDGGTSSYSSSLQNPTHTFQNPGTYTVTMQDWSGASSGWSLPQSQTITVNDFPLQANFVVTPTSGSLPLTVQFSDTSIGNATSWAWNFGDGTSSTLENPPPHTYTEMACGSTFGNGVVTIDFSERSQFNYSSKAANIKIIAPPDPVPSFAATPQSGPAPLTVQFSDTSTNNPTKWYWNFGDGTTLGNATYQSGTVSHTYTISGVYTASMYSESATTCDPPNPASMTITVLSPLAPTTATTSSTPTQTTTTATSTALSTTSVTAQTTLPAATLTQAVTVTPTGFYYTPQPITTTPEVFTPIPINTPTQKSPMGIECGVLAIGAGILIMRKQS